MGEYSAYQIMHQLVGCHWGDRVSTADDTQPCVARAVQIVVLHQEQRQVEVRVCARHLERLKAETTPRPPARVAPSPALTEPSAARQGGSW